MASNIRIKPTKKKPLHDLSNKGARNFEKADRNKMKTYGDEFDSRPRGRVVSPDLLIAKKRRGKNSAI